MTDELTTEGERITGRSLAARAAKLGREHGTPGRSRGSVQERRTERPVQQSMDVPPHPRHLPKTPPPVARSTDPVTSHDAAAGLAGISDRQALVLEVLRTCGPLTDQELARIYAGRVNSHGYIGQSDSGLRTRRRELVDAGFVYDTGTKRPTVGGDQAIVWAQGADATKGNN